MGKGLENPKNTTLRKVVFFVFRGVRSRHRNENRTCENRQNQKTGKIVTFWPINGKIQL